MRRREDSHKAFPPDPPPLSDLTEHVWLSVSPPSLPSSIGSRGLNYHSTGSASQCDPLLPFPGGLQQQIAMFTLAHDAIKACYCDLWLQDRINYWLMIGNTAVRVMERIVVASFSAGWTPAGDVAQSYAVGFGSSVNNRSFDVLNLQHCFAAFFTRPYYQLLCTGSECLKAIRGLCHICMIFSFPPRSFYCCQKSIKLEKGDDEILDR